MMKCVILFRSGFGGGLASGGSITHVPTWHIISSVGLVDVSSVV